MAIAIIADSCCDLTVEECAALGVEKAPLTILLNNESLLDTPELDTIELITKISANIGPVKTACPSVEDYAALMRKHPECFVVTLSSRLSGSYNAACVARDLVLEEDPDKRIVIVDSRSAAAGQDRIIQHIRKLEAEGTAFDAIAEQITRFTLGMHTLFVLEDLSTLIKNGRMSKVKGMFAAALNIHPVLADDGNGEIKSLHTVRGLKQALDKLVDTVAAFSEGRPERSTPLTMVQCSCPLRAQEVRDKILERCPAISDITIHPTSGLSTVYANRGGIILAF